MTVLKVDHELITLGARNACADQIKQFPIDVVEGGIAVITFAFQDIYRAGAALTGVSCSTWETASSIASS